MWHQLAKKDKILTSVSPEEDHHDGQRAKAHGMWEDAGVCWGEVTVLLTPAT